MNNKLIEKIIIMIVFIVVLILSFSFTIEKTKENTENKYATPLESITILNNNLKLEENKRTYSAVVDCSKYEENTQIIDYKLKKETDVIVRSNYYQDLTLLDEPSKEMTNFEIYLSLFNNEQEIVYHFNLVCGA